MNLTTKGTTRLFLILLYAILTTSSAGATKGQTVDYCLKLQPPDSREGQWIDPHTRTAIRTINAQPTAAPIWQGVHWLESASADRQYSAYLIVSDDPTQNGEGDLVIRSTHNGTTVRFPVGRIVAFDGLNGHFYWSHRGHRLAFFSWEYTRLFYQVAGIWQEYTYTAPQANLTG